MTPTSVSKVDPDTAPRFPRPCSAVDHELTWGGARNKALTTPADCKGSVATPTGYALTYYTSVCRVFNRYCPAEIFPGWNFVGANESVRTSSS